MFKKFLLLDEGAAGGAAAAQGQAQTNSQAQGDGDLTFEKWIEKQDEKVKGLFNDHTKGLKTALDAERESRKALSKQLSELAEKAEKGSDAEKRLESLSAQLELLERQTAFMEAAHREGVTNSKALFTLAAAGDFFDKKGNANFADLKKEYPEFFTKPIPKGNAGNGTEKKPKAGGGMNDFIRASAGRQ